jgi:hypothetical protein
VLQLGQPVLARLVPAVDQLLLRLSGPLHPLSVADVGLLEHLLETPVIVVKPLDLGVQHPLPLLQGFDLPVEPREFIEDALLDSFVDVAVGDETVAGVLLGACHTEGVSRAQSAQRGWLHSTQK